jgi:hypothetical protein
VRRPRPRCGTGVGAWVGAYHANDGFDQLRAGWEYDYRHGGLTLVPSAQAASHGFLGASVYAEVGRCVYATSGAGRTNLHPYWNLAFDPNDFAQIGVGTRNDAEDVAAVFAIHDVRLGCERGRGLAPVVRGASP